MNDIMSSAAFQEFLQKRCEEIAGEDGECERINSKILLVESEIRSSIPSELLKKFDEYGTLNLKLISHVCPLVYKHGIQDFKIGG
jgi:hypothetical protein